MQSLSQCCNNTVVLQIYSCFQSDISSTSCKLGYTAFHIIYPVASQVVDSSKLLISSLVDSLLRAADLCVPYLDGRYNVDADEVLPGDQVLMAAAAKPSEAPSKDATQSRDEESVDEDALGPNVTVLVTGVQLKKARSAFICSSGTDHGHQETCCYALERVVHPVGEYF